MDSYVRLLRKTTADKLWLIIDKILVKLPIIIVIISIIYPYNMDKVWIPMSVYYGKLLPINYGSLSIKLLVKLNYSDYQYYLSVQYG